MGGPSVEAGVGATGGVEAAARVSLGYLSEVERGQKEPSSELLAAICGALDVELSELFREVTDTLYRDEKLASRGNLVTSGGHSRISTAPGGDAGARNEPEYAAADGG